MSVVEPIRVKLASSPGTNKYVCYKPETSQTNQLIDGPTKTSLGQSSPAATARDDDESNSEKSPMAPDQAIDEDGDDELDNETELNSTIASIGMDEDGPTPSSGGIGVDNEDSDVNEMAYENNLEDSYDGNGTIASESNNSDDEINLANNNISLQSSRNKRKNFQPRNIVNSLFGGEHRPSELPLDLSDANILPQNGDSRRDLNIRQTDDEEDEDEGENESTADVDEGHPLVIDEGEDADSAMDLSTCVKSAAQLSNSSAQLSPMAKAQWTSALLNNMNRVSCGVVPTGSEADASAMKDYAEDTMKELLALYGLNNEMAESITQNVPLQNFSSGKILENLGNGQLSGSPTSIAAQTVVSNHLTCLSNMCKSNSNLLNGAGDRPMDTATTDNAREQQKRVKSLEAQTAAEELRNKVVDGMTKLTGLPPNNIIGNPRVILPQNMATTLLTLAALGNGQQTGAKAAEDNLNLEASLKSPTSASSVTPTSQSAVKMPPSPVTSLLGRSSSETTPPPAATTPVTPTSMHPSSHHHQHQSSSLSSSSSSGKIINADYSRYVKRFSNATECGSTYCKDLNYREHFHCLDCNSRVFIKKEEMIRHFKWHKKRDESLQHGFMRYSPMDDCSEKFPNCSHNRKQTHYHCLMESCDKVYISTSDVQMHANYHRKDSAIIKEGFQRFRATEDCGTQACAFYGQRTTHFHCRRLGCNYHFKNKADMEKHKSYHIKDEQLNKDGFKKFMKHEHCAFENCRFSRVCNHIHCIRPGCTYVLHSSGQLYSHKRKHERRDNEMAYRKFKLQQSMLKALSENSNNSLSSEQGSVGEQNNFAPNMKSVSSQQALSMNNKSRDPTGSATSLSQIQTSNAIIGPYNANTATSPALADPTSPLLSDTLPHSFAKFATLLSGVNISNALNMSNNKQNNGDTIDSSLPIAIDLSGGDSLTKSKYDDSWKKYMKRYTANDPCKSSCDYLYKDHYHCLGENCDMMFKSRDGVREHTRNHEQQDQVTEAFYTTVEKGETDCCPSDCPFQSRERHYHCNWEGCKDILTPLDKPFRRLDHYKMHEYSQKLTYPTASSPIKTPQAIFTSFKLPKLNHVAATVSGVTSNEEPIVTTANSSLDVMNSSPMFNPFAQMPQLSMMVPTTSAASMLPFAIMGGSMPSLKAETQDGFHVFEENKVCPDTMCMFAGKHHYHCNRPRCFYITDRPDILILHSKDFHDNIDISEGFFFFDRNVDCRLQTCPNNKVNRHFHCTRPGCNYSFVRYSTMSIHDQQHNEKEDVQNFKSESPVQNPDPEDEPNSLPLDANSNKNDLSKTVKAAGTFYPLSAFSSHGPSTSSDRDTGGSLSGSSSPTSTSSQEPEQQPIKMQSQLTPTLIAEYQGLEKHVQYDAANSCGRPFCKLKKRDHYHCNICNQAFSCLDRLKPHILKHTGTTSPTPNNLQRGTSSQDLSMKDSTTPDAEVKQEPRFMYNSPLLTSANMAAISSNAGPMFTSQGMPLMHPAQSLMAAQGLNFYLYGCPPVDMETLLRNSGTIPNTVLPGTSLQTPLGASPELANGQAKGDSLKRPLTPKMKTEELAESKRLKMSCLRILKDEPVPEGYIRYRFNEDCQYPHCGYREHQTHFHCMRKDCGYSFCDKTRFVQHTARHERLDTLMGGDFQQYRSNVHCGRPECVYTSTIGSMTNKASHFHCFKCDFVCTDTNKVVAHRRQHSKLDSIMAAGFEKFTPSQSCQMDNCSHNRRQTHYHCITCQYSVLGLSQMSAHRYRHLE